MNLESLVSDLDLMHKANATLLEISNRLAAANTPSVRALGYEIAIAVSKMTSEAKPLLQEIYEVSQEVGGMAD